MNAFLEGMARVLDLFGTMSAPVELPRTDEEAFRRDRDALAQDYAAVMDEQSVFLDPPTEKDKP